MMFYPAYLDIKGRECVVVGGGRVALRKVRGLLECNASVSVVSPILHAELAALHAQGKIIWHEKKYSKGDIVGAFLVIAATNDQGAQEEVFHDARQLNTLLNVADVPEKCNFILPARVQRGSLSISVSTGGKSPALAKMLRKKLEQEFDENYTVLNDIMGIVRPEVIQTNLPQQENERMFNAILGSDILKHIEEGNSGAVIDIVNHCIGKQLTVNTVEAIQQRLQS
nr:bifunctional precorrin-2 dehydrogenase/sirohydrochlorin ferrochelatase [Desulfobulbaceae bacterium]